MRPKENFMKRHSAGNSTISPQTGACLGLLLLIAIAAYAKIAQYTVTATIYNTDANNNPVTLQSDGGSTGYAVYQDSASLNSALAPDSTTDTIPYSQWNLSFGPSSSRSLYLTLVPANPNSPPSPWGSGPRSFKATLYSRCFTDSTAATQQSWTLIPYGSPDSTCGMRVLFTYGGVNYTLVMSPEQAATGMPPTGSATVTCMSSGTSACTAWTDVATSGITNANIANLYNGGSTPIGQYYLSFNISLTHP
jgi:hypothetical protein